MLEFFEFLKNNTATASAITAIFAVIVSAFALLISLWSTWANRKHNRLTVRPLAEIEYGDNEDLIFVALKNNGTGPLILRKLLVTDGVRKESSLIGWMPDLPEGETWRAFAGPFERPGRSIGAGGDIVLIDLVLFEDEQLFSETRRLVRDGLSQLSVKLIYSDIYNQRLSYETSLKWFGRHA